MNRLFLFFILLAIRVSGQTCDSAIAVYHTNHDQFEPITFAGVQIDTLVNGLIDTRCFSDGQPSIKYKHDSLGLLTSITSFDSTAFLYDSLSRIVSVEYFQWNGTSWSYKQDTSSVNYFYSANRLDSIVKSVWNGTSMIPFYRSIRFYNAADTLFQINVELYDSVSWYIDTLVTVSYTPDRIDSLYADGVNDFSPDEIRKYDSSERILSITEIKFGMPNMLQYYSYQCNQLSSYVQTYFGSHNSYNISVTFDSLCRIKKIVSGHYSLAGVNTEDVYEYYYTSCNTLVVRADEDLRICHGDTAELSVMAFGGTQPYHIHWNSSAVLPNDSSLMVYAAPDSSVNYLVTVTDANGLIDTDTISVHVSTLPMANIYISAIDTNSVCQSATLKTDSLQDIFYSWSEASSPVTLSNNPELNIIYNGTYYLVAQENAPYYLTVCPIAIDTFQFIFFSNPAPIIDINLECTYIVAHSTENLQYQWYKNNLLIVDSIRDTLSVNQFGPYYVIGVDSAGCLSAPSSTIIYQTVTTPLSLTVNIGHPSCDTCSDGYVNLQGIGGASSYGYMINGILTYSTYHDSLSAGLYQFCVIDRNNCVFCDSAVYLPVKEITGKKVSYYPNPFNDILYLKYPFYKFEAKTKFALFDAGGRTIKEFQISSADFTISRESLTAGIYFFAIIEDGVVRDRGKIVLN